MPRARNRIPGDTSEWKRKALRPEPDLTEADHHHHPVGRVGKPEDIAEMLAFLMSPEASFITGSNFVVDGRMTRKMIYVRLSKGKSPCRLELSAVGKRISI
jgi:NAD(P)-dependent dehydrogenase (short-subunit alcohol dehydrogenase family)